MCQMPARLRHPVKTPHPRKDIKMIILQSIPWASWCSRPSLERNDTQEASVQASALPNAEALSDEEENLNAYVQALDPVPHYSKEGSSGLFYFGQ
jgi:hypothetical protein